MVKVIASICLAALCLVMLVSVDGVQDHSVVAHLDSGRIESTVGKA